MSGDVPVLKDPEGQASIPSAWRGTLCLIANAVARGDYQKLAQSAAIRPIGEALIQEISQNVRDYGVQLTDLPEDTWRTSACQWMEIYWDVLVDLFSVEEGASDLALAVRVYEEGAGYSFEVQSVHVP